MQMEESGLAKQNGSDAIAVTAEPALRHPSKEEVYTLFASRAEKIQVGIRIQC